MCTVLLTSLRRVLSTFVLVCFLWTTLFQSFSFAGYEPVLFETRGEDLFARFNVSIQKRDHAYTHGSSKTASRESEFAIPLSKKGDRVETQELIDLSFASSIYEKLTALQDGFSWTSYGVDFHLKNSGDLIVSRNLTATHPTEDLELSNPHGAIIFKDDLHFDRLTLAASKVIQEGALTVRALLLQGKIAYHNKRFLSVEQLYFDDSLCDLASQSTLPQLINEGTFIARGTAQITGNGTFINSEKSTFEAHDTLSLLHRAFVNNGTFVAHKETTLSLTKSFTNSNTALFEKDVRMSGKFTLRNADDSNSEEEQTGLLIKGTTHFDDFKGSIENRATFRAHTMRGNFTKLENAGIFGTEAGFTHLTIGRINNASTGRIIGDGHLTVGKTFNAGLLQSKKLTLGIADTFDNTGMSDITHLTTYGTGTYQQRGRFRGQSAVMNNAHFSNETALYQPDLELSFGDNVHTFTNHKDITLKTKSLHFARSTSPDATATNEGLIETELFDNATETFINKRQLRTTRWNQRGTTFSNEAAAIFAIDDEAYLATKTLSNAGRFFFEGQASGYIAHLTSTGELVFHKKTALSGDYFSSQKTTRTTDTFHWTGRLFENTGAFTAHEHVHLDAETLSNSGTLKSVKGLSQNGKRLQNTGYLGAKGSITGIIDTIDNAGNVISEDEIHLTGTALNNNGSLKANTGLIYNGKTFTSSETAVLQGKKLSVTTTTPLSLKGLLQGEDEATFAAPSIENEAQILVIKGKTTFKGALSNSGKIDVDELTYEDASLTNTQKGTIEANRYQRTTKLVQLFNHGLFVIRSGGFNAERLGNHGRLELHEGMYTVDRWNNAHGSAIFDQLSLTSHDLVLEGELDVARLVSPTSPFLRIRNKGETIIRSGGFRTRSLVNENSLSLEKGTYSADSLVGHEHSVIKMHDDAHLTVRESENQGKIIASVNFTVDASMGQVPLSGGTKSILEDHTERCTAFTSTNASVPEKASREKIVYQRTHAITDLLKDKEKVNTTRYATDDEKRVILQAVMGSEITAHIHEMGRQNELTLSPQLPTTSENDPLFRHFEVLRLTEKLSRILINQVRSHGQETLYDILNTTYANDSATLSNYSGLRTEMFLLWFGEVLEQHRDKIPLPKKRQMQSTRNPTILSTNKVVIDLWDRHTERCSLFTSLQSTIPSDQAAQKTEILQRTQFITDLLKDKEKVDAKRHATLSEKKAILQAVMGNQITAHLHSHEQQTKLHLASQLPDLDTKDPLHKHFEILRLTEKMSRTFVQHITERGYETLHHVQADSDADNEILCTYSGLQKEMFLLWFKEIFEQHKSSFPSPKRATLTILGKENAVAFNQPKLGIIQTTHSLTLTAQYAPARSWISDFLKTNRTDIHIGEGDLFIEADSFYNLDELDLPYYVHFKTKYFANFKKLKVNGLRFADLRTFQNGAHNDLMGLIECYGEMDAHVETDFDNRFGVIKTAGKAHIRSLNGFIYVGNPIEEHITVTHRGDPRVSNASSQQVIKRRQNGAKIISADELLLESSQGLKFDFGVVKGTKKTVLKTPKTISFLTGSVLGCGDIFIDAHYLSWKVGEMYVDESNLIANAQYRTSQGYMRGTAEYTYWNYVYLHDESHTSEPSEISTTKGNIWLHLQGGHCFGSRMLSPEKIYIFNKEDKAYHEYESQNTDHQQILKVEASPASTYRRQYIRENFVPWGGDVRTSDHQDKTAPAIIQAGKDITIKMDGVTLEHSGRMNAPKVTLDIASYLGKNVSSYKRSAGTPSQLKIILDFEQIIQEMRLINHPAFINEISSGGGLRTDTLGYEEPLPGDMDSLPLIPHASYQGIDVPPLLFSPDAMRFTMMHALSQYLNTLNIRGTSGDDLLYQLLHPKKSKKEKKKEGQLITAEDTVSVFNEGTLFHVIRQIGEQFYRVPQMIADLDMFNPHPDANVSGHEIDILVRGKTELDKTVIAAYAPTLPQAKTQRNPTRTKEPLSEINIEASTAESMGQFVDQIIEEEKTAIRFTSLEDMVVKSGKFYSHQGATFDIHGNAALESTVDTIQDPNGFHQTRDPLVMDVKGALAFKTRQNLLLRAIEATSDTSILYEATGNIFDLDLALSWARRRTEQNADGVVFISEGGQNSTTSTHTAPDITFKSGNQIDTFAPHIRAKKVSFLAQKGVTIHDVIDTYHCQTEQHVEGKGWFGKDKEIYTAYQSMRSKGIDAGDTAVEIILGEKGDVELTNATIKDLVIDPKGGTIRFKLGKNYESFQRSEKSSNAFVQSQSMLAAEHQTASQSDIGTIKVITTEDTPVTIMIEQVRGQTAKFLDRIEKNYGHITQEFWDEVHREMEQSVSGITPACGALIAIAVGAVTFGTGAAAAVGSSLATSLGGATGLTTTMAGTFLAGAGEAMFAAGFTSLCTSAAVSLANNGLDPAKAAKSFASTDTLNSVGMSMLTAGMTHGMLQHFDIPTNVSAIQSLGKHAANQGVHAAVKVGSDLATTGRVDGVAVSLSAVAGTLAGYLSNKIGTWYKGSNGTMVEAIAHKTMHALNGAGAGIIIGGEKGLTAGALGAVVAETVADIMTPTGGLDHLQKDQRPDLSPEKTRLTQATARFVAGMVAFSAGMTADQIGVAMLTANTALDHNFGATAGGYLDIAEEDGGTDSYDGYESDTSKGLREQRDDAYQALVAREAKGEKPSFKEIYTYLSTSEAYEARLEDKGSARFTNHMLKEIAQDVYDNWQSYGLAVAESLPAGIGTTVTIGHEGYDIFQGDQTIPGAAGVLATDAAIGFVGGKFVAIIGKGLIKVGATAKGFYQGTGKSAILAAKRIERAESKFWTRHEIHEFNGKSNKVFKRDDLIDLSRVDQKSGLTNLQLMNQGKAPFGLDGKQINLHHMVQTEKGALAEVTQTFHQKYSKIIHINDNAIPSGIERNAFARWRSEYWKQRAVELSGGK